MDKRRLMYRILSATAFSLLFLASLGAAQPRATTPPPSPVATTAPAPNERDVAATQTELIRLLRLSPTLTTVVSHDPSLLSTRTMCTQQPATRGLLRAHPEVARNPEFYLFTHLKHEDGQPDEALERAVWPDVYRAQRRHSAFDRIWGDMMPFLAFACGLSGRPFSGSPACSSRTAAGAASSSCKAKCTAG